MKQRKHLRIMKVETFILISLIIVKFLL